MARVLSLVAAFFLSLLSYSQGTNFYITSNTLNIRSEASTSSKIVTKAKYCDNVIELSSDQIPEGWLKVDLDGIEGFVSKKYVKKGKCIKSEYSYRTGARCRDGSGSSATGRGACSHHGGVDYWITKTKTEYQIEDN